ncbi:unnamed protein product [Echinostoma caproni]|uniref:Uncharacterized protein n=1 Tax=Echinostoma caproni TaxID=27848 RepID=A0A183AKL4_9TREM|nr:unnamed protein product [Echinostoma caproni]
MRLQNLLPPEAIQRIRQIWQEIYGSNKSVGSIRGAGSVDSASSLARSAVVTGSSPISSLITTTTTAVIGSATLCPRPSSNAVTLREHFARRVRQVVRQYLGPNALVNLNRVSAATTASAVSTATLSAPVSHVSPSGSTRDSNSCIVLANSTLTIPTSTSIASYATVTQFPQVVCPQGTPLNVCTASSLPTDSTEPRTHNAISSPAHPALSRTSAVVMNTTTTAVSTMINTVSSQALITGSHLTVSGLPVVVSEPNKTQDCKGFTADLGSTSCVFTTTTVPINAIGSGSDGPSNPGISSSAATLPMPNLQLAPMLDLQPPPASRRASNTSQCCVLEWLLSDEADLCLLPPSFYETKTSNSSTPVGASTTTAVTSSLPSESSLFTDRNVRGSLTTPGALTIQLPAPVPGTGAILVSPVTPIATTPVRSTLENTAVANTDPMVLTLEAERGPELAFLTGTRTSLSVNSSSSSSSSTPSSSGASPIISSSPIHHRAGSLLVIGSEPTSPDVSLVRLDPAPRRLSDNTLATPPNPVYQAHLLSGPRSLDISSNNSSASIPFCQSASLNSTVLNTSDPRSSSTVSSTSRAKRRRSGPPTPLLNTGATSGGISLASTLSVFSGHTTTTTTNSTRTRHVSRLDNDHSRVTSTRDRSDGLTSPPFTSLTQLLLQDFPTSTNTVPNGSESTSSENLPTLRSSSYLTVGNHVAREDLSDASPARHLTDSFGTQADSTRSIRPVGHIADPHPDCAWSTESVSLKGNSQTGSRMHPRARHASSSLLHSPPSGVMQNDTGVNGCPSLFVHGLHLTATTVVSISTSPGPAVSSRSTMSSFYQHRPEDLPRYLKEVGPNVRVQLSAPPAVVVSSTQPNVTATQPNTGDFSRCTPDAYNAIPSCSSSVTNGVVCGSSGSISAGHLSPRAIDSSSQDTAFSIITSERGSANCAAPGNIIIPSLSYTATTSTITTTGLNLVSDTVASTSFQPTKNFVVTPFGNTQVKMESSVAQHRSSKPGNSYVLGYVPNPTNMMHANTTVLSTLERPSYAFTARAPLTNPEVLLVHSGHSESGTQPKLTIVCDPASTVTPTVPIVCTNSRLSSQSNAFVYSLSPSTNASAVHATVIPTEQTTLVSRSAVNAQLFVVPSPHRISPPLLTGAIVVPTASTSPILSVSQDTTAHIRKPRSASTSTNSRLDSGPSESILNRQTAGPDLLLLTNSVPLDVMFDSDSKPEESLLPDDIINDVFGLETMVAAKQHQNRQNSAVFSDPVDSSLNFARPSPTLDGDSEVMMDLHGLPSTASSSPSPCSPQLSNPLPPDIRSTSSCFSP